jgi:hypothetical protein
MKPLKSRMTILRVASLSRMTSAVTSVCKPFLEKAFSRTSAVAAASAPSRRSMYDHMTGAK